MARALPRGGRIVSVDLSPEMHRRARANLREAGVAGRVRLVTGAALDVLPRLVRGARFDLVFLDAAKQEYRRYAELALPALRRGGLLVADNLLWGGRTAGRPPRGERGDSTRAIRAFNAWLLRHPGLEGVLLPVGDGAGVAVRREGGSLRGPVGA
jgi:caffeoyl-CoA O-methyltransferase